MRKLIPYLIALTLHHTLLSVIVTGKQDIPFEHSGEKQKLDGHLIYATNPDYPFSQTKLFQWSPWNKRSDVIFLGTVNDIAEAHAMLIMQGKWVYISFYDVQLDAQRNPRIRGALVLGTNDPKVIDSLFKWEAKSKL